MEYGYLDVSAQYTVHCKVHSRCLKQTGLLWSAHGALTLSSSSCCTSIDHSYVCHCVLSLHPWPILALSVVIVTLPVLIYHVLSVTRAKERYLEKHVLISYSNCTWCNHSTGCKKTWRLSSRNKATPVSELCFARKWDWYAVPPTTSGQLWHVFFLVRKPCF